MNICVQLKLLSSILNSKMPRDRSVSRFPAAQKNLPVRPSRFEARCFDANLFNPCQHFCLGTVCRPDMPAESQKHNSATPAMTADQQGNAGA